MKRLKQIPSIILSKTGKASHTSFKISGNTLHFIRVNPKTDWELNIDMLYKVYSTQSFIITSVIKAVTGGKVNSPSVAILIAISCIDKNGNRLYIQ